MYLCVYSKRDTGRINQKLERLSTHREQVGVSGERRRKGEGSTGVSDISLSISLCIVLT